VSRKWRKQPLDAGHAPAHLDRLSATQAYTRSEHGLFINPATGRDHDHRDVGKPFILPHAFNRLSSVHTRHYQIHQDDIRKSLIHAFERLQTVIGLGDLVGSRQCQEHSL
jgi:hypothetical protein